MIEALELVSSLIARFAKVEDVYLCGNSIERELLADAIVGLYAAILIYLTEAKLYYEKKTGGNVHEPLRVLMETKGEWQNVS